MKVVLFAGIFLFGLLVQVTHGAYSHGIGKCPNNAKPGESTYSEGCVKCNCYEGGYECYSCGTMTLGGEDAQRCYFDHTPYAEQHYPKCCKADIVCRGNENFDESKMK